MNIDRVFIWGTGRNERTIREKFHDLLDTVEIVGYIDNDAKKHYNKYNGYVIFPPQEAVQQEFEKIIVFSTFFNDIEKQLIEELHVERGKIDNFRYFTKKRIINRYILSEDPEIIEVIQYIQSNRLEVFNNPFIEKYNNFHVEVHFDEMVNLFYILHHSKRMYFSRRFRSENEVKWYYRDIVMEQDEQSPHRYLTESFSVYEGDIVIDAGVAEGNFALDVVDRVSKLYLIESDQEWVEALECTFASYKDKVIIIHKMITDYDGPETICLDSLDTDKANFVKMDIEGCEVEVLQKMSGLIARSDRLRLAICCYHNDYDKDIILKLMHDYGLCTELSSGYMWYPVGAMQECYNPKLRRGLIRGYKNTGSVVHSDVGEG